MLYVVATPIGNLSDISPRVRETLEAVSLVAAEDTRVAMKLLNHLGLSKPCVSCHRHNEDARSDEIVERMTREDIDVALTCDAGTPGISDPGQALVDAAWAAGIPVVPISGPCAAVTALSAAGYAALPFTFHGFPPRERKPLRAFLEALPETDVPVHVLYESPHRVVKLVEMIAEALPEAHITVCCDLTKRYEAIVRGPCARVLETLSANPNVEKGEYALVLRVPTRKREDAPAPLPAEAQMLMRMLDGCSLEEAAEAVEDASRNDKYRAKLRVARFLERWEG